MEIQRIQVFQGRNMYSHRPVMKVQIDAGKLAERSTKEIPGFNESLVRMFPGLASHHCSMGYEGGFLERLQEGTYICHVTEHLILELHSLAGYQVFFGKTRLFQEPATYDVVFEYINERFGKECIRAAVKIVSDLAVGMDPDHRALLKELRGIAVDAELGPSTKAVFDEAKRRGIPVRRLNDESLLQLGIGKNLRLLEASLTDAASCVSVDMAANKQLTKEILCNLGIPVPEGDIAYTEESAVSIGRQLGFPLACKPYDGNQGKGVTLNIFNDRQLREAFREAVKLSKGVIVERQITGRDYRVLVVGDKVSAVAERRPPFVTGDGVHSIKELVELENRNQLRGEGHEKPLSKLKLDEIAIQVLKGQGWEENGIPAAGEVIPVRENANLSTGGTARECADEIHPFNRQMAVKAAKALGLDVAGIDITAKDIAKPLDRQNGALIEVNAGPGLRMHLFPTVGCAQNVAADMLNMLFPQDRPYSIPIVSVTGTNGKTTTTRLIKHILSLSGKKVGMTSTSGIYIGDQCILSGDNTGAISARTLLSNREVEAAVLETARGGIIKRGLGYDLADVGVVTNIGEDHLGMDGIESIEELAFVKSLVVEAIKPEGVAVLNAGDPMKDYLEERARCQIVYFSAGADQPKIRKQVGAGGPAVYLEENWVMYFDGRRQQKILQLKDIPLTFAGLLQCNIENALAATAACTGLGIAPEIISLGLASFRPDLVTNPGRFNIFDLGDFQVMLDYGHNPEGYRAVLDFAGKLGASRLVGIIGVPGDRLDRSIKEVGRICARHFSRIYIKEDQDLRGRHPGEVANLLFQSVMESGAKKSDVEVVLAEITALEKAIWDARPGDLIIQFFEEFNPSFQLLQRMKREVKPGILLEKRINEEIVTPFAQSFS